MRDWPEPRRPNGWVRIAIPIGVLGPAVAAALAWLLGWSPGRAAEPDPVHRAILTASRAQVELLAVICRRLSRSPLDAAECEAIARAARGVP